jgi:hypothetical protein
MKTITPMKSSSMFWHWLRKDFTALRGWFIAWALLLVAHCVLRLVQLYAGDYVLPEIFLFTHRPDHILQWILLAVNVPMVIQQDSPVGANFWKARPIKPRTLLAGKLCLVVGWFVLLPALLDLIYFGLAGFRGWDLVLAILYWALPRAAAILFLTTLASFSNDLGRFFIHLVFALLLALASWAALTWYGYPGSRIPFYAGMSFNTNSFHGLLFRACCLFAVIIFSVALSLRYISRWSVLACWIFCFVLLIINKVEGARLIERAYHKMAFPERISPVNLPPQPSSISVLLNLRNQNPLSLGDFKLNGLPDSQNAVGFISGGSILRDGQMLPLPIARETTGEPSLPPLHFSKSAYQDFDELSHTIGGYNAIRFFSPRDLGPDGRLDKSVIEFTSTLHCWIVSANGDAQLMPEKEGTPKDDHNVISFHPQRSPFATMHKDNPKDPKYLGTAAVLEQRDTRFGLPPFTDGNLASSHLALQEVRTGKITLLQTDTISHAKWQDATRFLSSRMSQLTTQGQTKSERAALVKSSHVDQFARPRSVEAERAAIVKSFQAHPEDWRIVFIRPKVVDEFDLPIHLTKQDLERGYEKAKDQNLPDLTLHFNPTTQRWETNSEP